MQIPSIETTIQRFFLRGLLSTARGRAYALQQAAIAESTDEGAVFERLAQKVDDPELLKMVRKHSEDETRHAALFFECADRQGVGRPHVPAETQVLDRLNARLPFYNRTIETREDVMVAYLLLQVIEERALEQFALLEPLLRVHDPVSADVIAEIAKDEERHLRYCHAIVKRYAPSEDVRIAKLKELREAESLSYQEHQKNGLAHLLANGYLSVPEQVLWRTVSAVTSKARNAPRTRFYSNYGVNLAQAS
jgi:rubrerythrin